MNCTIYLYLCTPNEQSDISNTGNSIVLVQQSRYTEHLNYCYDTIHLHVCVCVNVSRFLTASFGTLVVSLLSAFVMCNLVHFVVVALVFLGLLVQKKIKRYLLSYNLSVYFLIHLDLDAFLRSFPAQFPFNAVASLLLVIFAFSTIWVLVSECIWVCMCVCVCLFGIIYHLLAIIRIEPAITELICLLRLLGW